ncbi:MAG: hypothetical protein ACP5HT_05950 [Conexivisphaera sp.]
MSRTSPKGWTRLGYRVPAIVLLAIAAASYGFLVANHVYVASAQTEAGYVKYTLFISNGTLKAGNVVVTGNALPMCVTYDPQNGYIYVTNKVSSTVSIISTTASPAIYAVTFVESGLPSTSPSFTSGPRLPRP